MREETFCYRIIKTIVSGSSAVWTLIGVGITIAAWFVNAETKISLFLFVLISAILFFFIIIFFKISLQLFEEKYSIQLEKEELKKQLEEKKNTSIKVLGCIETYGQYKEDNEAILLTTNPGELAIGGLVSIFYDKNGFEIFVATGYILNIQKDEKVQILIPKNKKKDFDWGAIKKNEKDQLEKLIIKTIVTTQLLGER